MPGSANRRGGSQQKPRHGVLFPTQPNFTIGGDEGNDGLMRQQYGGNSTRGLDFNDDDFDPEKPEMRAPKGSVNASQHTIRYVPQWMQGSFGRGGVIPETGDGPESQSEGYDGGQPRSIHLDSYNGAPGTASKRFYEPVPDQENDPNSTQFRIGMRNSTPNGNKSQYPNGMDSGPRSALKRRGGNGGVGGGGNGFGGDADDLLRRGVSFDGDYVGQDRGGGGGGAGGRSFGGLGGGGGQNGARQGGNNQQDNFSRNKAKIHNRAMQLDPSASQELGKGRGAVGGNDGSAMSNGGERMAVIGVDERGNPIYGPTRQSNGAQSVDANAAASYECEDCHERVHPGSHPVFCEATGLRHF
ncbi:Hypothetical protein, putative [Bodo saltans]|uniref:Uncharacterized protein n=1 Tax=Bodo saltans TaxID=75058 RepID=A0A0S4ILH1_BODSA|nr:Hypothetical protein, putative [Bodo saltans]|eukprot:CUF25194.1 Hypothetical protein, putative [Bodo saltans]